MDDFHSRTINMVTGTASRICFRWFIDTYYIETVSNKQPLVTPWETHLGVKTPYCHKSKTVYYKRVVLFHGQIGSPKILVGVLGVPPVLENPPSSSYMFHIFGAGFLSVQ